MKRIFTSIALVSLLLVFSFANARTENFRLVTIDGQFKITGSHSVSEADASNGASYRLTYDEKDQLTLVEYLINGALDQKDMYFGITQMKIEYSEDGFEKRSYFNKKGKPTRDYIGGIYGTRIFKDEANNTISLFSYDKNGALIKDKYGVAQYLCELDDQGRRVASSRFDVRGNKVTDVEGFHRLVTRYDDNGHVIEQLNYGTDGELAKGKNEITRIVRKFDNKGNVVEEKYYGIDGQLKLHNIADIAMLKREYDEEGRLISEKYYGIDGTYRERVKYSGFSYAIIKFNYDDEGGLKKVVFLDKNENNL